MNISFSSETARTPSIFASREPRRSVAGFTLVELLVVVTIIGILASLITAAAIAARRRAKIAAVVTEISQLDMACKSYKERMGEYPPDFAAEEPNNNYYFDSVLRHLARAFPRYVPGVYGGGSGWDGFKADVLKGWGIDVGPGTQSANGHYYCSPAMALTFWLGGMPDWNGLAPPFSSAVSSGAVARGFRGFSANPLNPFDNSTNRIGPFYDFKSDQLAYTKMASGLILCYWPVGACGTKTACPILYFRANNGNYFREPYGHYVRMFWASAYRISPAIDTRLSNFSKSTFSWINPQSCQIFCAGLDVSYGQYTPGYTAMSMLPFPSGSSTVTSYQPETFDDITNFSNGTLEDAIP